MVYRIQLYMILERFTSRVHKLGIRVVLHFILS